MEKGGSVSGDVLLYTTGPWRCGRRWQGASGVMPPVPAGCLGKERRASSPCVPPGGEEWRGIWESNPHDQFGKLGD